MNVFELFGSIAIKGGDDANRQIDNLDKGGKRASSSVGRLEKVSVAAGKAMKIAFIGAAAAIGLLAVGLTKAVKEAADLEQITVAYEVLIGDVEKAGKVINDIKKASAKTPFQFKDLAKQGQTLMAFGIEADIVVDKMMMLGDVSMGNSVKMESIVRAYGKIQAKGKASLEELNMLTENGVPILEALSDQYEVTTAEMFKMITAGVVGFADVDQAIQSMTSEGGKFYGMLDKQSKTFTGRISTLRDNIQMLFAEVGSKLLPVIGPVIDKFTTKIKTALEELTDGKGPLAKFTEVMVNIIAWAVNNIPKIGITFEYVGEIAKLVAEGIGQVFDTVSTKVKAIISALGLDTAITSLFNVSIQLIGDTYKAFKKGIDTGDWSDFFDISIDWTKAILTIYATVALATDIAATVSGLFSSLSAAFLGTKFLTGIKGIGIGGVIAGVSVVIAIADTINDPEKGWGALSVNVGAAILAGLVGVFLTGSMKSGYLVFTIALNFGIGEKIKEGAEKSAEAFTEGVEAGNKPINVLVGTVTAPAGWSDELTEQLADDIQTGVKRALKTFDLVGAIIELVKLAIDNKDLEVESEAVGESIVDDVITGMGSRKNVFQKAWDKFWGWFKIPTIPEKEVPLTKLSFIPGKDSAMKIVKIGKRDGEEYNNGLVIGLNSKAGDVATKVGEIAEKTTDTFVEVLEDPSITTQIADTTKRWWDAMTAPGTMDPDDILNDIFGGAEQTVDDLDDLATSAETFWDRIVTAANDSGVSIAILASKWSAALSSMLTDVYNFVVETGVAFANGTIDWEKTLGNFGTIMENVLNGVFDALIAGMIASIVAEDAWLVTTLSTIATAVVGFLSLAFAALTSFFWFLGPFAPVAAGGVIAGAIAAIAALGVLAIGAIFPAAAETPDAETPDAEDLDTDTTTATGGRQISEITGPTRDLLVDLLTPLARLDSLTSIGNRIYDLLDERLIPRGAGVNIENITIYGDNIDPSLTARQIEEALGENIDFAQAGNL